MKSQPFAVFDIDGTFFRWQLFHEIVLELIDNGDIPAIHRSVINQKMREWKERTHHYSWREYETAIVKTFAKQWKFDIAMGQIHESKNGYYTEQLQGKVTHQKGELLKKVANEHHLSWQGSMAVGDSRTDVSMLELVEQPVAFNPTEDLFAIAKEKGWKIVVERKNMIYELEEGHGTYVLAHAGTR